MTTLELPAVLTVNDFHKMSEVGVFAPDTRLELIEGVIYPMTPIGATHAYTVNLVSEALIVALGSAYTISIQNPVMLSDTIEFQPDVAVIQRLKRGETPQTPRPDQTYLVVEVSDSTLHRDRTVKMPLYATAAIPELWIIDTTASVIEQYLSPQDGAYQQVNRWRKGDTIPTSLGATIAVEDLLV